MLGDSDANQRYTSGGKQVGEGQTQQAKGQTGCRQSRRQRKQAAPTQDEIISDSLKTKKGNKLSLCSIVSGGAGGQIRGGSDKNRWIAFDGTPNKEMNVSVVGSDHPQEKQPNVGLVSASSLDGEEESDEQSDSPPSKEHSLIMLPKDELAKIIGGNMTCGFCADEDRKDATFDIGEALRKRLPEEYHDVINEVVHQKKPPCHILPGKVKMTSDSVGAASSVTFTCKKGHESRVGAKKRLERSDGKKYKKKLLHGQKSYSKGESLVKPKRLLWIFGLRAYLEEMDLHK